MAATPHSDSKPSGENPVPVPLTFDEKLNQFWQKYRAVVVGLVVVIAAVIVGKGLWERMERQKELEIENAYSSASTTDQLRVFIAAHPGHSLAGVAELRIADEAYTAGKAADAVTGYEKALSVLKTGPLAVRAQIGRALAKVQAGKLSEGTAELKQLVGDANQLKAARAEAAYQLASLSVEAGSPADAQKYIDQLNQIDPASMWSRRAMMLQANLPKPAVPAMAPAAKDAPAGVQVKVPGK